MCAEEGTRTPLLCLRVREKQKTKTSGKFIPVLLSVIGVLRNARVSDAMCVCVCVWELLKHKEKSTNRSIFNISRTMRQ